MYEIVANDLATNLISALEKRFPEVDKDIYQKATYLDPRYKTYFFKADLLETLKSTLIGEICYESPTDQSSCSQSSNSQSSCSQNSQHSIQDSTRETNFWTFMDPQINSGNLGETSLKEKY